MKQFIRFKSLVQIAIFALLTISCTKNDDGTNGDVKNDDVNVDVNNKNIIEIGQETTETSTFFNTWIQSDVNLVTALSDVNGTYTVFAPSNNSFSTLLNTLDTFDSIEDFDTVEEKALLASILKYHIVEGTANMSSDLKDGQMLTTLQNENVIVGVVGDEITIKDKQSEEVNAAKVWKSDVLASNGVILSIDQVLLPQSAIDSINASYTLPTLYEIVAANDSLSILEAALIKLEWANDDWPSSDNNMNTIFAPTDEAFRVLFDSLGDNYNSLDDFVTTTEVLLLQYILDLHVKTGSEIKTADLVAGPLRLGSFGNEFDIIASEDTFVIGDDTDTNANIITADIMASNGVLHLYELK